MSGRWGIVVLCLALACAQAPETADQRIERLGQVLRCPVCRGVPIGESPATLAQEMMTAVREQVAAGRTDEQILQYFRERYGEWAWLAPAAEGVNLSLWILPLLFLFGGVGVIAWQVRSRRHSEDRDSLSS